jgi:uncharacterized protein (TIGR02145 family)
MKRNYKSAYLLTALTMLSVYSCDNKTIVEQLPILITSEISNIAYNTASSGGTISSNGGSGIISKGVCWSTSQNPTIINEKTVNTTGNTTFTSSITGLIQNTNYNVRAYATSSNGTAYGNQINFTTQAGDQSTRPIDVDGNVYHSVTIGTQVWMVENLKVTHFRNGYDITNVTDNLAWSEAGMSYCNYDNNENNSSIYGRLYNRSATMSYYNLAPVGWHVPKDQELFILEQFLGGDKTSGGKLKERGITHWQSPNTSATNSSGFTALPSGYRNFDGSFEDLGISCYYWSAGGWAEHYIWTLKYSNAGFGISFGSDYNGYSIRCIRD